MDWVNANMFSLSVQIIFSPLLVIPQLFQSSQAMWLHWNSFVCTLQIKHFYVWYSS